MDVPNAPVRDLRAGLIDGLNAARATEREILDAIDPDDLERAGVDGGWSAKDIQAHLGAWRRRHSSRNVEELTPLPARPGVADAAICPWFRS